MYYFKKEFEHVMITIRGKGVLTKKNIGTEYGQSLAAFAADNPAWAHNFVISEGRKVVPVGGELTIDVPELLKKKDSSLTSKVIKADTINSNKTEPQSESNVSRAQPENKKEISQPEKSAASVPTKIVLPKPRKKN